MFFNKTNTSYTRDTKVSSYTKINTDKNSTRNRYTNKQTNINSNKTSNISTSNFVDRRQHKSATLPNKNNKNEKVNNYSRYKVDNEKYNPNRSYNTDKKVYIPKYNNRTNPTNVYIPQYNNRTNRTNVSTTRNTVKLGKSFDVSNKTNANKYGNHTVYSRDYSNRDNKQNTSYLSHRKDQKSQNTKVQNNTNYRNNSHNNNNKINNNYYNNKRVNITSYSTSKTPSRKAQTGFIYNDNNKNIDKNNSIINISHSSNKNEKSFVNKTQLMDKKNIYNEYLDKDKKNNEKEIYKKINYFKRGEQTKMQIICNNNSEMPTEKYMERKEYEIIGRIVNDDKSIKLIDHNHPDTLYDPDCEDCKKLAKKNKLCLSNFKEESYFNNHGFHVTFGSSSKKGNSHSKFVGKYKKVD